MSRRRPQAWVDPAFRRKISSRLLREWTLAVLEYLGLPEKASIEIAVVGDEAIRGLNLNYRGLDEATDVLSFPYTPLAAPAPFYGDAPPSKPRDVVFPMPKTTGLHLGEVVISLPYAQRQAQEQGHPLPSEIQLLLAHGILHLIGHDHEKPAEEQAMQAATKEVLARLEHISDPIRSQER